MLAVMLVGLAMAFVPVIVGTRHPEAITILMARRAASPSGLDADRTVIAAWLHAVPRSGVRLDGDQLEVRYLAEGSAGTAAAAYIAGLVSAATVEMRPVIEVIGVSRAPYATTALGPYEGSTPGEVVAFEDANGDGAFQQGVEPKLILGAVACTARDFASARATRAQPGPGEAPAWEVDYSMTTDGRRAFAELTQRLVALASPQNQIAILVDGVEQGQPPQVVSAITDGRGTITGRYDRASAMSLAAGISAGALPVPLQATARRTVQVRISGSIRAAGMAIAGGGLVVLLAVELATATRRRRAPAPIRSP